MTPTDVVHTDDTLEQLLREPATHADPYPLYERLRRESPVLRTPIGYVLTRHADVTAVLRDPRFSSDERHSETFAGFMALAEQVGLGPLLEVRSRTLLFMDPPDHTRLRRLVSKAFTGRAVEAMRSHIEELVDGLLDQAAERGGMDVVRDLAYPLPVTVISEMLGLPVDDRGRFEEWTRVAVRVLDPGDDFTVFFAARDAFQAFAEYFDQLVPERRANPGDDLLSGLLAAEDAGDVLTHDELLSTIVLLFIAGHETTVNLIGNGVLALLRHPDQLARLAVEPSLAVDAVEELLRYDSPVQLTGRVATTELEVAGVTVEPGQQVTTLLGAANRDPAAFAAPDRLDLGRGDHRHVAFGGGIHLCLGAPLARVEAQVAIHRLVSRFPDLGLATTDVAWKETVTLRGPEALPVAW